MSSDASNDFVCCNGAAKVTTVRNDPETSQAADALLDDILTDLGDSKPSTSRYFTYKSQFYNTIVTLIKANPRSDSDNCSLGFSQRSASRLPFPVQGSFSGTCGRRHRCSAG